MGSPDWTVYTCDENDQYVRLGRMSFYKPETNEVYTNESASFEGYSVSTIENGNLKEVYRVDNDDMGAVRSDMMGGNIVTTPISVEEMDAFRQMFINGVQSYGPSGTDLTMANINLALQ